MAFPALDVVFGLTTGTIDHGRNRVSRKDTCRDGWSDWLR